MRVRFFRPRRSYLEPDDSFDAEYSLAAVPAVGDSVTFDEGNTEDTVRARLWAIAPDGTMGALIQLDKR